MNLHFKEYFNNMEKSSKTVNYKHKIQTGTHIINPILFLNWGLN
jgi:hypothetical protein